MKEADTEELN